MTSKNGPGLFTGIYQRWIESNRCALCVRAVRARLQGTGRPGATPGPDDVSEETARRMLEFAAQSCSDCEIVEAFRDEVPEFAPPRRSAGRYRVH
jgi:hypothetical protein